MAKVMDILRVEKGAQRGYKITVKSDWGDWSLNADNDFGLRAGDRAELTWEKRQGQRGNFYIITAAKKIGGSSGGSQGGYSQRQSGGFNSGGDKNERMIFITGVVGRAMGGGQFTVTDIKLLTLAAADAYDALSRKDTGHGANGDEPPPPGGEDDYGGNDDPFA